MTDFISEEVRNWATTPDGKFLRADDFRRDGLLIRLIKPVERTLSTFIGEGADKETNLYTFFCPDATERTFTNGSKRLMRSFIEAQVKIGDVCRVRCEGEGFGLQWTVEKLSEQEWPLVAKVITEPAGLTTDEIPF